MRIAQSLILLLLCHLVACSSDDFDSTPENGGAGGGGGAGGAVPDLETRGYDADDERIQYMGRVDFTNPSNPRFSAPAVTVTVRFKGTGVSLTLKDEFKYGTERNFYDVSIDGERVEILAPEKDTTHYDITDDLTYGEHTLTLAKRTESSLGSGIFQGVEIVGELMAPPPEPERRMLFFGDSITAGAGVEAANNSDECGENAWGEPGGWGQPYHDANLAFGPVLARELDAAYHVEAVSGIGLVRNYTSQYDTRPMPEVYDSLYLEVENSPAWDPSKFVPDAIVIGLGTNDFSPGDDARDPSLDLEDYTAAYVDFVDALLDDYPDAQVFCMMSPMLGDGWPDPADESRSNLDNALDMVAKHYTDEGNDQVHKLEVAKMSGQGCGTHPNAEQHAKLAEEIRPFIEETMGW